MKKFGIIALLLLVLTLGGMGTAHFVINGNQHDVTIEETTISGDKAFADGITVKAKFEDGRNTLNWWTTYSTTDGKVVDCKTDMINDEWEDMPYIHLNTEYLGYGVDDPEDTQMVAEIGEAQTGIPASEVLEKINAAERSKLTKYTFKVADYLDYFPVYFSSNLPGDEELFYDTKPATNGCSNPHLANYEYFQIPVPKGLTGTLKVTKDKDGNLKSWNMSMNSNQYQVESDGVFEKNGFYLATSGIGMWYEVVDYNVAVPDETYHILDMSTETHGIHYIPMNGTRVDMEHAKCVYFFEENEKVLQLEDSYSGKELLLYTCIGKDIYFSVIEKDTMKCLKRVLLMKDSKLLYGVIQGDNFILTIDHQGNFVLLDTCSGSYNEAFRGSLDLPYYPKTCSADYNGERFVFASCIIDDETDENTVPHFSLQIFDKEGLRYRGAYHVSLIDKESGHGILISPNSRPIEVSFDEK